MFDINKLIARHICLARICSDSGKGKRFFYIKGSNKAYSAGYSDKELHILLAIKYLNSKSPSQVDFSYYVKERPDQNSNLSRVVYFYNKKLHEQISFHTFGIYVKRLKNKGTKMSWNRQVNSSYKIIINLIKLYNL